MKHEKRFVFTLDNVQTKHYNGAYPEEREDIMMNPRKLTYVERKLYGPWYIKLGYLLKERIIPALLIIAVCFICSIDQIGF